jgi:SAM-dependent methyltransferase
MLGEIDEAVGIFDEWLKEEPDHPIALTHEARPCSGRDVPARHRTRTSNRPSTVSPAVSMRSWPSCRTAPRRWSRDAGDRMSTRRSELDVLDAGCGTGLCGPLVAPFARRLVGSTCPRACCDQARARNVYDELVNAN